MVAMLWQVLLYNVESTQTKVPSHSILPQTLADNRFDLTPHTHTHTPGITIHNHIPLPHTGIALSQAML